MEKGVLIKRAIYSCERGSSYSNKIDEWGCGEWEGYASQKGQDNDY